MTSRGYLTPQTLPEMDRVFRIIIPASEEWFSLIYGALYELTRAYNWEQASGGITIEATIERWWEMLREFNYRDGA